MANNEENIRPEAVIIGRLGQEELAQNLIAKWMDILGEPLLSDDEEQGER